MSANYADKSGKGQVVTNNGVDISQQNELGSGSYYFDGSSYLTITDSDNLDFDTNNFTISFWWKPTDLDTTDNAQVFLTHYEGSSVLWTITYNESVGLVFVVNGTNEAIQGSAAGWSVGEWYHVAVVRNGNNLRIYRDGIMIAENTSFSESMPTVSGPLYIGRRGSANSQHVYGHMEEIKIVKNQAVWTANFLPPSRKMEAIDTETKLLVRGDNHSFDYSPAKHTVSQSNMTYDSTYIKFQDTSLDFGTTSSNARINLDNSIDWFMDDLDFTVEAWVYVIGTSAVQSIINAWGSAGNKSWFLGVHSDNKFRFIVSTDGTAEIVAESDSAYSVGWHHVVGVRSGSTTMLFVDGVKQSSTGSVSGALYQRSACSIGVIAGSTSSPFGGYMDEIRVSKGVTRWTSDFSPPFAPYPKPYKELDLPQDVDTDTSLLCHFDGDDSSTDFYDYSKNEHSITPSGSAEISTDESVFGDSCLKIGATDGVSTIANDASLNLESGEFTIEFWINRTLGMNNSFIMGKGYTSSGGWGIYHNGSGSYQFYYNGSNIKTITSSNIGWTHIAYVRKSDNRIYAYVDGQLSGSDFSFNEYLSTTNSLLIGDDPDNGGTNLHNAYIDEIRITKGLSRYNSEFEVPDTNFPDAQDQSTKLLLHMQNLDGNTYFQDDSASNHVALANVNATLSTTKKYFGTHSLSLDGSSWLEIPSNTDFDMGNDFTIDFFINFTSTSGTNIIMSRGGWGNSSNTSGYTIYYDGSLHFAAWSGSTKVVDVNASWSPVTDTWYHIAVVRETNDYTFFVDGSVLTGPTTDTSVIGTTSQPIRIGSAYDEGSNKFSGYIDEFRFTNGIARWTSAFTKPSTPYPNYM